MEVVLLTMSRVTLLFPGAFFFYFLFGFAASWGMHQHWIDTTACSETSLLVTHLVNYNAKTRILFKKRKQKICHSSEYLFIEDNSTILLWVSYHGRFPWFSPPVSSEMISHSRACVPWCGRSGSLDPKCISLLDPKQTVGHLFRYLESLHGRFGF